MEHGRDRMESETGPVVVVVVVVVVRVHVRVRVRDQRHIFVSIATMRTSSCLARRASSGAR